MFRGAPTPASPRSLRASAAARASTPRSTTPNSPPPAPRWPGPLDRGPGAARRPPATTGTAAATGSSSSPRSQATAAWARRLAARANPSPPTPPSCSPAPPCIRALARQGAPRAWPATPAASRGGARPRRPHALARLLLLERVIGREEDVVRLFDEVRHRHAETPPRPPPDGRPARRTPPRRGPGPAARGVRLRLLGRRTGPGRLAAAVLPVVAHAERYRVLAAAGSEPPDPPASGALDRAAAPGW